MQSSNYLNSVFKSSCQYWAIYNYKSFFPSCLFPCLPFNLSSLLDNVHEWILKSEQRSQSIELGAWRMLGTAIRSEFADDSRPIIAFTLIRAEEVELPWVNLECRTTVFTVGTNMHFARTKRSLLLPLIYEATFCSLSRSYLIACIKLFRIAQ